jgi:predicted acylesterase/phospholipase RssA
VSGPPAPHLDTRSFLNVPHARALAVDDPPTVQRAAVDGAAPVDEGPRKRLTPEQVKYIVFEGGGGKGFAYLGALQALETRKVVRYLKPKKARYSRLDPEKISGIGGASAGAITAFLLSIGYTPAELTAFMAIPKQFDTFFDGGFNGTLEDGTKVKRLRPVYRGALPVTDTDEEKQLMDKLTLAKAFAGFEATVARLESSCGLLPKSISTVVKAFDQAVAEQSKTPPVSIIAPHLSAFMVALTSDWGFFAGGAARALFDKLLGERMPLQNGRPRQNTTFEEHFKEFQVELLVTGTNLLNGKTHVFSSRDTPDFAVADAIRISMGIPFAFKPVVIRDDGHAPKGEIGVWVDGGLLNNLPFREFDDRAGANPKTLALRLDFEKTVPIESFQDFLSHYLTLALLGPGEAFITANRRLQTIELDTTGLSLLNFAPEASASGAAQLAAKLTTLAYFDPRDLEKPSRRVSVDEVTRK